MRTNASARWMKKLLRFMGGTSNSVILSLKLVRPYLVFVGAVFIGLSLRFQADAPAAGDHLPAHLVVFGRAQRHVGEVGVFNRSLFDVRSVHLQSLRQI